MCSYMPGHLHDWVLLDQAVGFQHLRVGAHSPNACGLSRVRWRATHAHMQMAIHASRLFLPVHSSDVQAASVGFRV